MTQHKVGTPEEWQAARDELLAEEKELTRRNDELARKRRELPWVQVGKEYSFETSDGTKSLAELFDGHSQLLIYHFMFGPEYVAGCPVCSSIADNLDPNAIHLAARDVKLMLVSRAPLEKLHGYKKRMGWSLDWASTVGGAAGGRAERRGVWGRCGDVRVRGARPERVHPLGRHRLPHLRDDSARSRTGDGLLRPPGPHTDRPQRGG
jgi:hypothetical protein